MKKAVAGVLVFVIAILSGTSGAYNLPGRRWSTPQTTFYVDIPGANGLWNTTFEAAMAEWNARTSFSYYINRQYSDPCSSITNNGVAFNDTLCGDSWGSTTLAVTTGRYTISTGFYIDRDIIFNRTKSWNVYSGSWQSGLADFRRVAVHELGHAIGLGHEDSVPSIMHTYADDTEVPQPDDIAGVNALYGSAPAVDSTGPAILITSHSNGKTVSTSSITISGTATDSARGDSGISSVTVNGVRASGDIATGSGTANWSQTLTLSAGANVITVVARDNSLNLNATTSSISVTYNPPAITSSTASTYHVFPQFADGWLGNSSYYRTTVMIANPSSSAGTTCTLRLYGLTLNGSSTETYSLGPNGWTISPTNGNQSFQSGYATLQCSLKVEAQLLYSFYSPSGTKLSEATVFSSPPATWVQLLADGREGSRVGLAIANDSDQGTTYTITAYNASGSQIGTTNLTLNARSSRAAFLDELLSIPPNTYGQVYVSSNSGMASLIGLRFTGAAFTTIPATSRSVVGGTASTYHVFPQFADGVLPDGSYYRTTPMVSNPSSTNASCSLRLYGLTVNGSNVFTVTLSPGGWMLSPISSNQSLRSGYATLQCSASVEAQLLYSYYSAAGTKISEATVFSSPSAGLLQLLADSRESARLGLAIANDTDQSATYTLAVGDAGGNLVGTTNVTLGPRSARAAFLDEFLPIPSGNYGQVLLLSNSGTASLIGLRFTGGAFTTIPETIR